MLRGIKRLHTAQAALVAVSAIMIVTIVAIAMSPSSVDDYGVEWRRPANMTLDSIEADAGNDTLVLTFHLWDSDYRATEWSGHLSVQVADSNNDEIYRAERDVRADHFTTVKSDGVVDTYYRLLIPLESIGYITEGLLDRPEMELAVRATFSFGQRTLVSEEWWWSPPTYVKAEGVYVDERREYLEVDVFLFDDKCETTKWSGHLRIIVRDSTGFEMYNTTSPVSAREFNHLAWGTNAWYWYKHWIPFDEIARSMDRLEEENGSGRCMTTSAWFHFDGNVVKQDPDAFTAQRETKRIPDGLLVENRAPVVVVEADRIGIEGREQLFDASGTTDDLGADELRYVWSWGDGSLEETTMEPFAAHTFARAGSFDVELRVVDIEGASSVVSVDIEVLRDPRVDPDDYEPGAVLKESYLLAKLKELAGSTGGARDLLQDAR
jgi:hypothetical protein